jgi:hypothetical protein
MAGNKLLAVLFPAFFFLLAGCSGSPEYLKNRFVDKAVTAGFRMRVIETENFELFSALRWQNSVSSRVVIYIEGDGRAWLSKSIPATQPTPVESPVFAMAHQDVLGNVLYLARPCQYEAGPVDLCEIKYWTSHRYSEEIVESYVEAIASVAEQFGFREFVLVGYSGGGVIASLLASRLKGVELLVTVAANLDHPYWTNLHGVSPLSGSLRLPEDSPGIESITQHHFVGADDTVVPARVLENYLGQLPDQGQARLEEVEAYDHRCCWAQGWRERIKAVYLENKLVGEYERK